jgi:hypothetical protein
MPFTNGKNIMRTLITLITVLIIASFTGTARAEDWSVGQYKLAIAYDSTGDTRLSVSKGGEEVFSKNVGQYWFITVARGKQTGTLKEPSTADVTGDGIPDLVIEQSPRRLACCWSYTVLSLGPTFKEVASAGGFPSPMTFEDVNKDGRYELVGDDWTFFSWYASPRLILHLDKGEYRLATNLMRKRAPTNAELAAKARENKTATLYAGFPVPPEIYRDMLDLIYSGNAPAAWKLLDQVLPSDDAAKKKFVEEITEQLKKSPYGAEILAMNGNVTL